MSDETPRTDGPLAFVAHDPVDTIVATFKRRHWRVGSTTTGKGVAFVFGDDESNARRLVACWNACQGIGTEYLETTTSLREADIATKESATARERALREALEEVLELIEGYYDISDGGFGPRPNKAMQAANLISAALGKVRT